MMLCNDSQSTDNSQHGRKLELGWGSQSDRRLDPTTTSRIPAEGAQQQQQKEMATDQYYLPTELWIEIGSHLRRRLKDLMHLALVSKAFRSIYQPEIYRVIQINTDEPPGVRMDLADRNKLLALHRSLSTPWLGNQVTVFRFFDISSWNLSRDGCGHLDICSCQSSWEKDLGDAIIHLPNLQKLTFYCRKSHSGDPCNIHLWLADLQTQNLRQLEFGCHTRWSSVHFSWLYAPCMRKLTALKLAVKNTLDYHDAHAVNWVASNRPIKRLICGLYETLWPLRGSELTDALIGHGNSEMQLLYAKNIHVWLSKQSISPYRNLTSVGSIHLEEVGLSTTAISETIMSLSFLRSLKFIEFSIKSFLPLQLPTQWSDQIFANLDIQNSISPWIYLVARPCGYSPGIYPAAIYESTGGSWKGRPARYLTYWQIAAGYSYESDE
ncbi:hypothetical protein FRC16_006633 [Serendipita sp. 398]|nr:hypothetical protein FRC16_006633 [Serendipita sp. 398]